MNWRSLAMIAAMMLPVLTVAADLRPVQFGQATERHLSEDEPRHQWVHDPDLIAEDHSDVLADVEIAGADANIVKLRGLVPAVHFASGVANIPASTVRELRTVLDGLATRLNVRLHLVGHADNQALSPRLAAMYLDNEGLSRERAGEVTEFFQTELNLAPENISYEWHGANRPIASNDTLEGRAANRRVEVEVWYDREEVWTETAQIVIPSETRRVKVCRMEDACKLSYRDGHNKRTRVQNLIAPLYYNNAKVEVTAGFVERIRRTLANLSDRSNIVVRFIGHTDGAPLDERTRKIYGDHEGLSRAKAWRVALDVQEVLDLPTARIDATGLGTNMRLASNNTADGRAQNRRVAVEFWYDDPLQELPSEPSLCPVSLATDMITRVHQPQSGSLPKLAVGRGEIKLPVNLDADIYRALAEVQGKEGVRVRFVGYTSNRTLDRRTAAIYGDDVGLSSVRAQRAAEKVRDLLDLDESQIEYEGRGFVHSQDVVNAGFPQDQDAHVALEVVYDEMPESTDLDGINIQPMRRELQPESAFALNLMRITVNGEPVDDLERSSADMQRCTDVALDNADIQFTFNNLSAERRLSVNAHPENAFVDSHSEGLTEPIAFQMHANYLHFIKSAEVRIFSVNDSSRSEPLAVLPIGERGETTWSPIELAKPGNLKYVLRAYGEKGNFDETATQSITLLQSPSAREIQQTTSIKTEIEVGSGEAQAVAVIPSQLLADYGDTALAMKNISLSSGTVKVTGSDIPSDSQVWVAGHLIPLDAKGAFITEQILPEGAHTVEVAVLDKQGNGELFLRDLEFKPNDWFYVGMADMTFMHSDTSGDTELIASNEYLDEELSGRLAFYTTGKFGNKWRLTGSVDTREGEYDELFRNIVDKTPDALLRRIDPDYHYPTFGDDSTVIENAPTSGKMYLKVGRLDTHGMWGNFNVGYDQNELARVDRGLYGINVHHAAAQNTSFGERRFAFDAFAAEPGTMAATQEFRGTGGSLYFLKHQDLLNGSERLRVELRDGLSGLVTGVVDLRPSVDYEIDYLQGTVILAETLASTVQNDQLVRTNALSGDDAFLVVRYEYSPGLDEIDSLAVGAQGHYWINDSIKVGLTGNINELDREDSDLQGGQLLLRKSAQSWVKLQGGQLEGQLTDTLRSDDGGFDFADLNPTTDEGTAMAYRADVSMGLSDYLSDIDGQLTFYRQEVEAGYTSPGLISNVDTEYFGGTAKLPLTENLSVNAKSDRVSQYGGLNSARHELNFALDMSEQWQIAAGVQHDSREDERATGLVLQELGERLDALLQVSYRANHRWSVMGYVQDTVSQSDTREDNGRVGLGGRLQWSDELAFDGELSIGDRGPGGRFGSSFSVSDRTSLYLNYAMENERTDNVLQTVNGRQGNLVAGAKTRLSDSTSVYAEERFRHSLNLSGYTHATGINYRPTQAWNLGLSTDMGTLQDRKTGAETVRNAVGFRASFKVSDILISSAIEYRKDENERLDLTTEDRQAWLFRTSFKAQMSESGRWIGKVGHSTSESSLGDYYAGGFTEASLGYALRPVQHDRFDALLKYTYFFNVPTTGQVTLNDSAAEYVQKSHVAAVDLNYRMTANWSIGGKYAYRLGEISLDREDHNFFDNRAHLYVLRTDYRLFENWEVMLEGRQLTLPDFDESRTGGLITVSRYLGAHLKVGVGYSLTDFSDDLTDLNFDHRGTFLNIVGTL